MKAQGNALGTCETNDKSPKGAKCSCIPITPFQGFDVRYWRFLGRCPRLSQCAALRQTALGARSVQMEQDPDNPEARTIRILASQGVSSGTQDQSRTNGGPKLSVVPISILRTFKD